MPPTRQVITRSCDGQSGGMAGLSVSSGVFSPSEVTGEWEVRQIELVTVGLAGVFCPLRIFSGVLTVECGC